jgi:hypothetical protein
MSGSIESRLANLEHAAGADICPTCGLGRDGLPPKPWTFASIDLNAAPTPKPEPQPCPACHVTPMKFGAINFDGDNSSILPPASTGKECVP